MAFAIFWTSRTHIDGKVTPAIFFETGSFNRPYTFGICDYRGEAPT